MLLNYQAVRSCRTSFRFLVLSTAGIGFFLGAWASPVWQVAVESAQVLAGIVRYPAGNSFYIYHVKLWTIVNQLLALLLKAGLSERVLSVLTTGALAALCYVAVGVCAFAISKNAYWGIAAPLLIDFSRVRNTLEVNYPMDFVGMAHTYGVVGLGWVVLTISLLALGKRVWGGLFLGLAPAMHPSLGAWCWIVVALTLLWKGPASLETIRAIRKPFAVGVGISLASLLLQLSWMRNALPSVPAEVKQQFIAAWVEFFDYHRRPVDLTLPGVEFGALVVVAGLYLILILDEERDATPLFLIKAMTIAAAIALGGAAISLLPPSMAPAALLTLMPTRLFLVSNLLFAAALIGFLGRYSNLWMRRFALLFVLLVIANTRLVALFAFAVAATALMAWKTAALHNSSLGQRQSPRWLAGITAVLITALGIKGITGHVMKSRENWQSLNGALTNPVLKAASGSRGLLVIGQQCCFLTQLVTRRPLLVEANALDQIPYAPESAPVTNEALKAIYGVDLLNPPESVRSPGLPEGLTPVTKPLWEARTAEEWARLGARFGFTQILTNNEWRLQLPEAARDPGQILYDVPTE